jgi:hypothetical protein
MHAAHYVQRRCLQCGPLHAAAANVTKMSSIVRASNNAGWEVPTMCRLQSVQLLGALLMQPAAASHAMKQI